MVDWNKLFASLRRVPAVGGPGMHMQSYPSQTETAAVNEDIQPTPAPAPVIALQQEENEPTRLTEEVSQAQIDAEIQALSTQQSVLFFMPSDRALSSEEQEAGRTAHRHRLANVTSSFEAPIDPVIKMPLKREPTEEELARGDDVPLLMPSTRFYWCSKDRKPGITVGYGTFFERRASRRLSDEDQRLLPSLQILNTNTGVNMTTDRQKASVIRELYPYVKNDDALEKKPYYVSVESADEMLRQRFDGKTNDLDRLLSNRRRRKVAPRDALVDWVASDMYYQGALSGETGIPTFAQNIIDKTKLDPPNPKNLRLTARRTCSDLQAIIDANPFTPEMTEVERQEHARNLAEYCTAYTAHQMTRHSPDFYYTRNHVQAHIKDLSSLAIMDIARNYYGRDLAANEVRHAAEQSSDIADQIFEAENPHVAAVCMSVGHEATIKNPLGHYKPSASVLQQARRQLDAEQNATRVADSKVPASNQSQQDAPQLTAALGQAGQCVTAGDVNQAQLNTQQGRG